jgi:hypothetical protein
LSAYSADADNDNLTYSIDSIQNISTVLNGSNLTFRPQAGFIGIRNANITVNDSYTTVIFPVVLTVSDGQKPQITFGQVNATYTDNNVSVNYNITDNSGLDSAWYTLNGGAVNALASFNGTINLTGLANGNYNLTVFANDTTANTNNASVSFNIFKNYAPSITNLNIAGTYTNDNLTANITIAENEQTNLTAYYKWLKNGAINQSGTKTLVNGTNAAFVTLPSTYTAKGENWTLQVFVNDGEFNSTDRNESVVIANSIPAITNPGNRTAYVNMPFSLQIVAFDADGDNLTYSDDSSLFDINSTTGLIKYTADILENGTYTINVTVNDSTESNSIAFNIEVIAKAPSVSNISIIPTTAYNNDNLNCYATLTDVNETNLIAQWTWSNGSISISGTKNVTKGVNTLISTLNAGNTTKGENWTCSIVPSDGYNNGTINSSSLIISNSAPTASVIPNTNWAKNTNKTINLTQYFADIDGDSLTYSSSTPANIAVAIDNATGMATLTPGTDFEGTRTINFTAYDNENANITSNQITLAVGYSTFVNSWVNGTLYNGNYFVNGILSSIINISTITGPTIYTKDSKVYNSTIINSTLINCTVLDSTLEGAYCENAYIDPSTVQYSNVTGSTVTDSTVLYSNATNSVITDSEVYNSNVNDITLDGAIIQNVSGADNYIENSSLYNTVLNNATVTDNVIYNGTITMPNGTVTTVTIPTNLTEYVNYAPIAVISAISDPKTPNTNITFTSGSTDKNIGGSLNDSLTYLWNFGDGSTANTENATHAYAAAGTYNLNLTVTDRFGSKDVATATVSIAVPGSGSTGSHRHGGSTSTTTTDTYSIDMALGAVSKELVTGNTAKFTFERAAHTVYINNIYSSIVILTVNSDPQTAFIELSKAERFDLNNDNYYDLKISVESISTIKKSTVLKFELIHEAKAAETAKTNATTTTKTTTTTTSTEEPKAESKSWITITGDAISSAGKTVKENLVAIAAIAGYIVLIVIILLMARKLAGKKRKKAQIPLTTDWSKENDSAAL